MNITKGQFRWLLTASIAAEILGIVASLALESSLPAPLREYLRREFEAELTIRDAGILVAGILLLIALIVSLVGLYRFWRFARLLTIIVWISGMILQIFVGPTVDPGIATALYQLGALLTGAVLTLSYMPPAKGWFEKTRDA